MGLFDIFKRRSKQADKKQPEEETEEELSQQADSSTTNQDAVNQEEEQTTSDTPEEPKQTDTNSEDVVSDSEQATVDSQPDEPVFEQVEQTKQEESGDVDEQPEVATKGSELNHGADGSQDISKPLESIEKREELASETATADQPTSKDESVATEVSSTSDGENRVSSIETIDSPASEPADQSEDSKLATDKADVDLTSAPEKQLTTTEEPVETEVADSVNSESADISEPEPVTEAKEEKYEQGLTKSRTSFGQKLNALFANFRSVDEEFFDRLEDMLIESDVGFETSMRITDELRDEVKLQNAKKPKDVQNVIVQKMIEIYDSEGNGEDNSLHLAKTGPSVLLFVGVNGVGKTTTIGKLAKRFKDEGQKVLLVAADTFRAGAIEQLNVWAQRDGVDIIKKEPGSDPAAAVFDGVKKAKADDYDILMVDTAGRLQNKVNLMNELAKMKKILTREIPDAPHEVLLVLDATTGQNAMTQAKTFKETTDVSGIVLTKLDGTAKGGIVLAIRNELHLPVKLVGLGEKVTDLADFDPNNFVYGLFKGLFKD